MTNLCFVKENKPTLKKNKSAFLKESTFSHLYINLLVDYPKT